AVLGSHRAVANTPVPFGAISAWSEIGQAVARTPFVDTHEHLIEEKERFLGPHGRIKSDDWTFLFNHYIDSDLFSAGMSSEEMDRFMSPEIDPLKKWKILEPHWPAVRNTGYGQAVAIAIQQLYGVEELSSETVSQVQDGYKSLVQPGFYEKILKDTAGIESCQVNSLEGTPFMESQHPTLLMQDISIVGMHIGPDFKMFGSPTGVEVKDLSDWHRVIDWWFDKYADYAVAVKSQAAYVRDIDYEDVPAEKAEPIFKRRLNGESLNPQDQKALEDHLFWYAARKATACKLPVKLHTGYYAGHRSMPLSRLIKNPGSATDLCRTSPETTFVFMHICYPYYEEMVSVAKQYPNAHMDMCWAWIISPVASVNFLKSYLVTAPANKILTFGGDYICVEPVAGHAAIARQGLTRTLGELFDEGWLNHERALALVEPIMCGNARRIFRLEEKKRNLKRVPWVS
ncbi:MAG: amidohydrolase family protein, partial [bacterium]